MLFGNLIRIFNQSENYVMGWMLENVYVFGYVQFRVHIGNIYNFALIGS
jgi:hypothetical protein